MSHPNPYYDPNDYLRYLIRLAISSGDAFRSRVRNSIFFYENSYNLTLKDVCENIFVSKEGELYYD